ncbi:MAG: cytochrome P450 [Kiloniellaceae bacterium]
MTAEQSDGTAEAGRSAGGFDLDFEAPGYLDDPYPLLHALRDSDPVFLSPWGDWYLTRFADVSAVLSDKRFQRQSPAGASPISGEAREPTAIDRMLSRWMVFIDPPAHTRLRRLVGKAFTPKLVAGLRGDIRIIADRLLDDALDSDGFDVIADFAYPLPVIVVSRILGVPAQDYEKLKTWSGQLTGALDSGDSEELASGIPATEELMAYMGDLIAARRREPGDDLISAMLAGSTGEEALSEEELLANCVFLLWAGHETTKNLIGNGTLSLIRCPGEFERLAEDPKLLESAVDEFLRYESPIQKIGRWTAEEVVLGGTRIPAGQYVVSLFGAANRDPRQYREPDRLDIGRRDGTSLAFGKGIHHCLGYGLAKLEGEVAFEALLKRVGAMELKEAAPRWQPNTSIRGLQALPVAVIRR